ncbi:SMI1/KNR4 family protein [Micromonospora taraxaci]|uniref:SUKH superfamily protein n=1 Tax=Micromonospora taraxaci TaxID=1316803 RepID=A0A561VZS4_9ACTN|nr:SMI1/KNR4 family protein [Micromonospora taraxaci]TWG17119.1 SUKH superfamily protein [Micromonospora taraxaci]
MSLQKLITLVPAPDHGIDVSLPQEFAACEAELGLELPADFKELLTAYGAGMFLDYLFAYPLAGDDMNIRRNTLLLEGHAASRGKFPMWYPYPLYPEAGGLLLWGGTYDGHSLCWLTRGEPDEWPVVVWNQHDSNYQLYEGGAVAFIVDWLKRTLPTRTLPRPPRGRAWFEPARKLKQVYVYLDGGAGSFRERARLLRQLFGPVQDRGFSIHEGDCDVRFATAQDWRVTYSEWPNGRLIRIAFPAVDEEAARAAVINAIPELGHTLRHAQTVRGTRVWVG